MKKTKHITVSLDEFTYNELLAEANSQKRPVANLAGLVLAEVVKHNFLNRQTVQPLIKARFIKLD
jgi:hypothetical protein